MAASFPHLSRSLPAAPALVLSRPTRPSGARTRPQELGHWFCSQKLTQNLRCLPDSLQEWIRVIARWLQGLLPEQRVKKKFCSEIPEQAVRSLNHFRSIENHFRSIENAEIEDGSESIPILIHQGGDKTSLVPARCWYSLYWGCRTCVSELTRALYFAALSLIFLTKGNLLVN